jgi:uncharacterized protein (DUF736 family)
MTTIGSFLRTETGFSGSVKTSNLHIDNVRFIPAEGGTERGPDFRIYAENFELGAAWKKTSRETKRTYHSVKLDDPGLPLIFASLIEAADGKSHNLVWSRRSGD